MSAHHSTSRATRRFVLLAALAGMISLTALFTVVASTQSATQPASQPTIVLVHGAWADASSWNGVIERLQREGYPVLAPANPLRGLPTDAPTSPASWPACRGRWCSSAIPTAAR
jgi:pimeloyl-ACP methyl ester carboxylesterase